MIMRNLYERRTMKPTKAKPVNKKDLSGTRPQELSDLLRQALQQPGVRELMAVYEHWKTLENVAQSHCQALGMRRIISTSNVSGPMVRQIH
jgi:hypothetical protein